MADTPATETTEPTATPGAGIRTFVARQPIFTRRTRVFGYELLFRTGWERRFTGGDTDHASRKVIADSSFLMDLGRLAGGKRAFINVTRDVLLNGYIHVLPPDVAVIEILEDIDPSGDVLEACRELRARGYRIALDDFTYHERLEPLVALAEFLKVDVLQTAPDELERVARAFRNRPVRLLAEKTETHESVEHAARLGFELFQGFYFRKPVTVSTADVPGHHQVLMRLLAEIHRPDIDRAELERLIKSDVGLSYKLLRYVNAAHLGLRHRIDSIHRALVLLGEREIRRWSTLVVLTTIGSGHPPELLRQALVRAHFCERLAPHYRLDARTEDLFLTGMFSVLDALLGRPIAEVLGPLPVSEDVKSALEVQAGALAPAYRFLLEYEQGRWSRLADGPDEGDATHLYLDAIAWGSSCLRVGLEATR